MDPNKIKTRYRQAEFDALPTVETFKGVIRDGTVLRAGGGLKNLLVGHTGPDGKTTLVPVPAQIERQRPRRSLTDEMMDYGP